MALRVVPTSYGRAAVEALRREIARVKRDSPLAPVTVVVPGNSVGVGVRRLLAAGELGPVSSAGTGLIGVNFLIAHRLAELLAAPGLAALGRRPVSAPVVAAAVRQVLATDPGPMFAPVASHPATEEALVGAHRQLSDLEEPALALLARQSERAREVVRIHGRVREQLAAAWYDEHDLMRAASEVVDHSSPLLAELGTIVCHLPQRLTAPMARLLRALEVSNGIVVIAGLTGVAAADAVVVAGVERLGGSIDHERAAPPEVPHGSAVCSTSDPDDEARLIVRGVVDAMRDGVPLERMAVVFGNADPYARLLHEHLELAGIAHNGAAVRTLADSVLGRALLRLLALPDRDFRRDDVFGVLSSVPVLDGAGHPVPAVAWERISRAAGIVSGMAQWRARLERYARSLAEVDRDGSSSGLDLERARAAGLARFVDELGADLARAPGTWSGLSSWAAALVARWIGDDRRRQGWSAFEQAAALRVEAALERLGGLDAVEPAPSPDTFRRSLQLELEAGRDLVGRLGEGLLVGPAVLALGVELDRLWVCGLAEGVFPAPPGDDPLLADADRVALAGDLPLRRDRTADDQRALLAAVAATSGPRVLCFPRGDLRRNTEHVPSRFVLDTIEALTGTRPVGTELDPGAPWYTMVPSYVHGLTHAQFPPTRHELDVRAALGREPRIGRVPEIARGLELTHGRRGATLTRFDGNLGRLAEQLSAHGPGAHAVDVSATRLETWVRCPHAYFVKYVLGVDAVERPEEIVQLSPLERGNVVHEVLENFFAPLVDRDGIGRPWPEAERRRLHETLRATCAALEARGVTGRRLLWARAQRELHAELDALLDADGEYRAETGAATVATELGFGRARDPHPAVVIALSDGRTLHFVGSADRVDRCADGHLVVIDYKTGSATDYRGLSEADPLLGGRRLQLPIYAQAARALLGSEGNGTARLRVDAYYLFTREPRRRIGYEVDPEVEAELDRALRVVVDGIAHGVFAPHPSAPGFRVRVDCAACDPDGLGTADAHRDWLRKRGAPELAEYVALIGEVEVEPQPHRRPEPVDASASAP